MSKLNCLGYQILSDNMRRKVFGDTLENPPNPHAVVEAIEEMERFGVKFPISNPESYNLPDFEVPELIGHNISDHFCKIAESEVGIYRDRMVDFTKSEPPDVPTSFENVRPGWNFFENGAWRGVSEPTDDILVFDTETFVKGSSFGHPIIGTAVGKSGYFLWLHPALLDSSLTYEPMLVPIGQNKVIIAHNAAFDHTRVVESYLLEDNNRWFDTMSAHINCSGLASGQRFYFTKEKTVDPLSNDGPFAFRPDWVDHGSLNNLVDCYKFHTKNDDFKQSDKEIRDIFVKADSLDEIRAKFDELVYYALSDVRYTQLLYNILLPKYLQANPSLTTLAGHFALLSSYLPVVSNWDTWLRICESKWNQALEKQTELLSVLALEVWEAYKNDEIDIESDPWLSQLDWSMSTKLRKNGKPASKWYGIPQWLRDVSEIDPVVGLRVKKISSKTRASHLLLRLKWKGSPIVYNQGTGWTYEDFETSQMLKIPHPKSEGANVGSVLSKDFLPDMESGTLSSDLDVAREILQLSVNVAYWTSARSRVLAENVESPQGFNVISPQVVPHNTSTNRAGCALWLTVPDPKKDKIGSEIKSRVQAPNGWKFVSSDFDRVVLLK